jgi:alpha-amylase
MKKWIYNTNVYEVNLRQYTQEGTIKAFMPHLERLRKMGVETLWFMPLTPISEKHKKGSLGSYYACSDYTSISAEFGTEEAFRKLVEKAHSLGFKIIIDWVANHTGWDHEWTISHPEWYKRDETGAFQKASGMDDIIELDFLKKELREAMIQAMISWIKRFDIDGFRCDLASWVQVDFWIEAKKKIDEVKDLFWLAEADALESPEYMQVFDAAYTWKWMHRTAAFAKGETNFSELIGILQQYRNSPGIPAWFTSNHDENSWNGTEYEKYGEWALGLAVFSLTFPGIPLVYSGQELPNRKRLEFFEKDTIEWNFHPPAHQDFYTKLLGLKNSNPALHFHASMERVHTSADENVLAYVRKEGEKEVLVVLNFFNKQLRIEMYDERVRNIYRDVFSEESKDFSSSRSLMLPGDKVPVTFIRNGKEQTVSVNLKKKTDVVNANVATRLKADLATLPKEKANRYGLGGGVVVNKLFDESPLARARIQAGFIIFRVAGQKVNTLEEFNDVSLNISGTVQVEGIYPGNDMPYTYPVNFDQ